jgi:hypothetical protein
LNCPAANYRFTFGKRISCCLFYSVILLNAHGASAFFSNGKINEDLSYRSLHVEILEMKTKSKTKRGGCYLVGEILNNTNFVQEDVSVTFYAFDFFDHSLWKQTVRIDILDPYNNKGKGCSFRKKLHTCEVPAKFQFKVTGVKREEVKKAFKFKADPRHNTKSTPNASESMDSRQKSDSSAVDTITTPVVPTQNYLIVLTNGKNITSESYREEGNMVFLYKNGGEVQISKEMISEIKTMN